MTKQKQTKGFFVGAIERIKQKIHEKQREKLKNVADGKEYE